MSIIKKNISSFTLDSHIKTQACENVEKLILNEIIPGHGKIKDKSTIICLILFYTFIQLDEIPDIPAICQAMNSLESKKKKEIKYVDIKNIVQNTLSKSIAYTILGDNEGMHRYNALTSGRDNVQKTIKMICKHLNIGEEHFDNINICWDMIISMDVNKDISNNPCYSTIAALVYFYCYKNNFCISRKEVAEKLYISYSTITTYYGIIQRILK